MTNTFKNELRHLSVEAGRVGLDVRKCVSGGYSLVGKGWLVHSPDVVELWSALHRLSKTEPRPNQDQTKTKPTDLDQPI